jgi:hypothetical protein
MNRRLVLAAALAVTLVGSACNDDSDSGAPASTAATGDSVDLKGVCPETVVIQKDWQPESEHGFLYNLVAPVTRLTPAASASPAPWSHRAATPAWTFRFAPVAQQSASSRCLR